MHRCKEELPVAVSCSVKRSEAVITNQKAMRAFLTVAVPSSFNHLSASTLGCFTFPIVKQLSLRIPASLC